MVAKPPRNFANYAAMEALNILLVPGAVLWLAPPRHAAEAIAMSLGIAACTGFLLIGAFYWAALGRRLTRRDPDQLVRFLGWADRLEMPMLGLTGAALLIVTIVLISQGWSWPLAGALALALLAVLEYVNYYHRQLQHFDRWKDFHRLLSSRRLPRSHMARDLEAFRRGLGPSQG